MVLMCIWLNSFDWRKTASMFKVSRHMILAELEETEASSLLALFIGVTSVVSRYISWPPKLFSSEVEQFKECVIYSFLKWSLIPKAMPSTLAPLLGVCYNSASAWSDMYLCLVPYIVLMSKSVSQEYACLHTACFPIWNQRIKAEAPLSVLSPEFERCKNSVPLTSTRSVKPTEKGERRGWE